MKESNHDHYWVQSGHLFESYRTLRGLRYRRLRDINIPDCDSCTQEMIDAADVECLIEGVTSEK